MLGPNVHNFFIDCYLFTIAITNYIETVGQYVLGNISTAN